MAKKIIGRKRDFKNNCLKKGGLIRTSLKKGVYSTLTQDRAKVTFSAEKFPALPILKNLIRYYS